MKGLYGYGFISLWVYWVICIYNWIQCLESLALHTLGMVV
jgi:hypothetical protein